MAEAKTANKSASKAAHKASGDFYAVFTAGGKQYGVKKGDRVKIEKILGEHKEGDKLSFDQILLVDNGAGEVAVGAPFVGGAKVEATLAKIARYKTVDVIKYKQKSRYFKKYGHRQPYFEVVIDKIG